MSLAIMRWRNLRDPVGEQHHIEWPGLVALLSRVAPYLGPDDHPGWSPTLCDPQRRGLENVRRVFALCLDYDSGETLEGAREALRGLHGLIHTTRKHTDEAHRFRVVLPLARPVSPFEFSALWRRFNAHIGGVIDQAPKDPSRFWYLPGILPDGEFEAFEFDGEWLDPDEWLARPEPAPEYPALAQPTEPAGDRERRAIAYVARMEPAISGSEGHRATWAVARKCAADFQLDYATTLRILRDHYNPRCQPPWDLKDLEHKAREAVDKARVRNPVEDRGRSYGPTGGQFDEFDGEIPEDPEAQPAPELAGWLSMADLYDLVIEALRQPQPERGLPTGFARIDRAIGGLRGGLITVVGAKRGFGKTTFGNAIAKQNPDDVAVFAGEDAPIVYAKRFLADAAGLNALRLRDVDPPTQDEWRAIMEARNNVNARPFLCPVNGRPVEWIAGEITRLAQTERPPRIIIVDYLQCLTTRARKQDRRNEVTHILRTLVNAIRATGAAGVLFSQLKRSERAEPDIEDLKESGDIEDGADHILLGWKQEGAEENGTKVRRYMKLAKNKDGQDGADFKRVELYFDPRTASFRGEVDRDEYSGYFDDNS